MTTACSDSSRRLGCRGMMAALAAAAMVAGAGVAGAQELPADTAGRMLAGPTAGFSAGLGIARIPIYGGSADCGEFTGGTTVAPRFGGLLLLPELFGERLGLGARLTWAAEAGSFSGTPVDPQRIFDPATLSLVELERELRLETAVGTIGLDLPVRYALTPGIAIGAGPWAGYRLSSRFTATDNVSGPGNRGFADGQKEHPLSGATPLTANPLAVGALLSGSLLLPMGPRMMLAPELLLRAELTSPVREAPWRTFSAEADIAVLFDITPSPAPPPPPPVIVEAPIPPRLKATLAIFGVDTNHQRTEGAVVRVREIVHRQHSPLLPVVFFDSASPAIASRYEMLAGDGASFSYESLAGADILDRHRNILNVIGGRMQADPKTTITLHGLAAAGEPASLATVRAAAVREYLEEVWKIDRARISSRAGIGTLPRSNEATADGRAENRRVEIVGSAPDLTAPMTFERTERRYNPPTVKVAPEYIAEAGIKSWRITLRQGGKPIEEFSGGAGDTLAAREWSIDGDRLDPAMAMLEAELSIMDKSGQTVTASASVPLLLQRQQQIADSRRERSGSRERLDYLIAGFDYNSSGIGRGNETIVRDLAELIEPGATVTITGYTDRIGLEQYNGTLSRQRAERVARELRELLARRGVTDVKLDTEGAGAETNRFANDLPEGRMLSRGVRVVVVQGAEEDVEDHP